MQKEQYLQRIKEIEEKVKYLNLEKQAIRDRFVSVNAEFRVGDKVRVFSIDRPFGKPEKEILVGEAFISRVYDDWFQGEIKYEFVKVKKDGNPSNKSAGIYSYSRLELIK